MCCRACLTLSEGSPKRRHKKGMVTAFIAILVTSRTATPMTKRSTERTTAVILTDCNVSGREDSGGSSSSPA